MVSFSHTELIWGPVSSLGRGWWTVNPWVPGTDTQCPERLSPQQTDDVVQCHYARAHNENCWRVSLLHVHVRAGHNNYYRYEVTWFQELICDTYIDRVSGCNCVADIWGHPPCLSFPTLLQQCSKLLLFAVQNVIISASAFLVIKLAPRHQQLSFQGVHNYLGVPL